MPKFLHWNKNSHLKDDVEAHPSISHESGHAAQSDFLDLGEYPALDRYISTYRDEGGAVDQEKDQGKTRKLRWWQFWKSHDEDEHGAHHRPTGVPDAWLTTDIHSGMSQSTVDERRKFVGWNELTTEKKNVLLKIITYFMGPILYGKLFGRHLQWEHASNFEISDGDRCTVSRRPWRLD